MPPENPSNRPAVDATLDGRTPILADPTTDPPLPGVDPAKFSAAVTAAVDARIEAVETRHTEQMDQFRAQSAKDQTIASLDMLLAGNPGDDLQSMQFRSKIVDLKMSVLGGTDTPLAEIITKAGELHAARMQVIQERGGDGSGDAPRLHRPTRENPSGLFSIGEFMGSLGKEIVRLGDNFEAESMTGSAELDYAKSMLDKPHVREQFAAIQAGADPRSRVVPIRSSRSAPMPCSPRHTPKWAPPTGSGASGPTGATPSFRIPARPTCSATSASRCRSLTTI